ncbi:iron-sulfur cluster assembly scaffold protein [Altererythrobacter sp. C41]|uniref:iron-sulfur cluster assembly scaffold protein n=1 Tax=Altererythrobacter sp. C41 TaxID=2806021 RepID=UPI00193343AA|nr:iron-sulfur cluster assembly scaffold protein [Altererythrobacter sp. C41]MBM0168720.1 iron-sulfur cluster assembly scaffold protein [Altererythrobacter sp. C41]
MTAAASGPLYTPELLALAVSLADSPLSDDLRLRGEAVSRTCGSTLTVGLQCDDSGRIERVGVQVSACAVGQASAAIFAGGARGTTAEDLAAAEEAIAGWLAGGDMPVWPGIEKIAAARAHPGRHGAILLPWRAARAALSKAALAG